MNLLGRSLDYQMSLLDQATARLGFGRLGSIPDDMSFRQWCEHLGREGLKVDGKPFTLSNRPALIPVYDAIPTHAHEAYKRTLVIQKATQLGLTVWEMLADIYMARKWGPINIGLFLPDQATAANKSETRFMPIVRSSPELLGELTYRYDAQGNRKFIGEGNVMTREIASSYLMFLWTSGKVSTESRPMDVISLDEVQEMTLTMIDKVDARIGDSTVAYRLMLSTANVEGEDINRWYLLGSQEVWHTRCDTCGELSDLSDPQGIFPTRSITYNTGQVPPARVRDSDHAEIPPRDDYVWTCPHCTAYLPDPQVGEYLKTNGSADPTIRSFLLPRTISPRITARDMITKYERARTGDQKKSFFNRTLARPYLDPDQVPITKEICRKAVEAGKAAGVTWESSYSGLGGTFMGIDQMGSFNVVVIKRRLPDNRQAVIHVEAIFDDAPFDRCGELMDLYSVACCVVEQLPNVNDARRFANKFGRRVFLCIGYGQLSGENMRWSDDLSKSERKTAADERTRYTVELNQYKCMQATLDRIRDGTCLFPDPNGLVQDVLENGERKRIPILEDWVFLHLTRTGLVVEEQEKSGKKIPRVLKIGIDPHFSFAMMLCDVAWARVNGTSTFILPDVPGNAPAGSDIARAERIEQRLPGLPAAVVRMMADAPEGSCGRCSAFKDGQCIERDFTVRAIDPGCDFFDPRRDGGAS
ncbi:MAG: phage terminase large subunit family protein [Acetobacter aceti]